MDKQAKPRFTIETLEQEIINRWGAYGSHIEVFREMKKGLSKPSASVSEGENRLVRIAIDSKGILVRAGDPDLMEVDNEYMEIIRQGGTAKTIPLHEYKKLKLYEPYPLDMPVAAEVKCMDCGLPYSKFALDTVLPHEQWKLINPKVDGLLCANCICKRADKLKGVIKMEARIFYVDDYTTLPIEQGEDVDINKKDVIFNEADLLNGGYVTGELLPCPFCDTKPISYGKKNEKTGNTTYFISCTNHHCHAQVFNCYSTAEEARSKVIEQWNKREPLQPSADSEALQGEGWISIKNKKYGR